LKLYGHPCSSERGILAFSRNHSFVLDQQQLASRKAHLRIRATVIQAIRLFFVERDYLEVDTPHLIPAPAPELHIDAVRAGGAFLHTSPELCMKRLLAAGYPRIFQICKCFRQDERGGTHLPEFTMLEWYRAGTDYSGLMDECEDLILYVSNKVGLGEEISYQGNSIDFRRPWQKISVTLAFESYAPLSVEDAIQRDCFDQVMVEKIEPCLGRPKPTFLYDYPASLAALARIKAGNPRVAERFELYIAGIELANAFSELTDAREQELRFQKEKEKREQLGKTVYPLPEKFLQSLPSMPESAGIAFGIDRLVMLFCDQTTIDSVVAFTPEEV
jgi:elongation factor P--(R)-beta-lysine ligase